MKTSKDKHTKNAPDMPEIIPSTKIAWSKTKEEAWTQLYYKIENATTQQKGIRVFFPPIYRYVAAAMLTLLISTSSAMYFYTKTIRTNTEQNIKAWLPDNYLIEFYPNTVFSYKPLIWMISRNIKLEGKAYFEVKKGKTFEVFSKRATTVVLGTKFIINTFNHQYDVTCETGKVKVRENKNNNEIIITGGQKAVLNANSQFNVIELSVKQEKEYIETKNNNNNTDDKEQSLVKPVQTATNPIGNTQHSKTILPANKTMEQINESGAKEPSIQKQTEELKNIVPVNTTGTPEPQAREQEKQTQSGKNNFKASLSPEQIKILENKEMTKAEKRKAFMESLSAEQRKLLDEQVKEGVKQTDNNLKNIIQDDDTRNQQKTHLQEQINQNSNNQPTEKPGNNVIENDQGKNIQHNKPDVDNKNPK
jgi:hypothetical protein